MASEDVTLKARYTVGQEQVQLSAVHPARAVRLHVPRDVVPHDHSYHEVCLVLSGTAVHHTATYNAPLVGGTALVVPPGQVHAISQVSRDLHVINLYYLAEWLTADLALLWQHPGLVPLFLAGTLFKAVTVPQFQIPAGLVGPITRELDELAAENALARPSPVLLRATLLKALATLTQAQRQSASQPEAAFSQRPEIWHALQTIDILIAHNKPLHVPDLADQVHLSADHLTRLFKAATGSRPNQYFQQRRVHKACHLLLDPRLSITTIAHALGYADSPHLTRLFKKYRKLTPREYRRTFIPGAPAGD